MNPTGAPRLNIDVQDFSTLINTTLKGKVILPIRTERGKVGKVYDIGSEEQYRTELGGLLSYDDGPFYALRALQAGANLAIIPVGKYGDPSNPATLSGVKASYSLTQGSSTAAGSTVIADINAVAITTSGTVSYAVARPGQSDLTLGTTSSLTSSDTLATATTAGATAINANTGTTGYSAAANTTTGELTITAPVALGAWGRNLTLKITDNTGGITFANLYPKFTGGADTLAGGTMTLAALERGTAYNAVVMTVTAAASNNPNLYDISLTLTGSTLEAEVIRDVPKLANDAGFATKIQSFVGNSRLLSSFTYTPGLVLQPSVITLINGTDGTAMSPIDYIGDRTALTNMYAADNVLDATKICIPAIADPTVALALAAYVDERQDMMGLHRVPLGITPQRALDYRNGTGSYNHTPINSWRNLMFAGGIQVVDPRTGVTRIISEIGDVCGIFCQKDANYHEWFSFAGTTRGVIRNADNVGFNMLSKGLSTVADSFDRAGLIPVVMNAKKVIYLNGDNSLYQKETLLKKSNVGELLIFMHRTLGELVSADFEPNDVESWKSIYRRVQPFMERLKTERAIWDYIYQGDQDIADVSQAVINNSNNIDGGMYKLKLGIKPKVNMKYVWITIDIYNSGFNFSDVSIN